MCRAFAGCGPWGWLAGVGWRGRDGADFDFEEVFRRSVDLVEGLLAGFGDGLHFLWLVRY